MSAGHGHEPHGHGHGHDGPVVLDEADWQSWADDTELEGEVLVGFVTETAGRIVAQRGPAAPAVRRIVDLGSGPGVGSCELARCFPDAEVVAVDGSPAMLERAARRAAAGGLADRVRTIHAELPAGFAQLDELAPVDVVWASMSLHHVGDEVGLLREVRRLLGPDGLLAIVEFGDPLRFLPDDASTVPPGLVERIEQAGAEWFGSMRQGLGDSSPTSDPDAKVVSAGYEVVESWLARLHLDPPLPDAARRFLSGHARRLLGQLGDRVDGADRQALVALADPDSPRGVAHRADVHLDVSRRIVVGRALPG